MSHEQTVAFDHDHAAKYDQRFEKLAAMRDALHLIISAVFADLPADAKILCVGAGTGHELLYLARKFGRWRFVAVEPSAPMLEICRRKAEEYGITSRCMFHEGYLESLPPSAPFDAATSLLVSQFILAPEARVAFFRSIAERLRPGGFLASADLASDTKSDTYRRLLEHFTPTFLLGLTATPERTDGADLLALCGENLVYRCDLVAGIRRGLLSR